MKMRILVGALISLHGLLRIFFINDYINFVNENFLEFVNNESLLTVGAALLPFLEFFVGLLIIFRIRFKAALVMGLLISVIMSVFILMGSLYPRLIYHSIIILMVISLLVKNYSLSGDRITL